MRHLAHLAGRRMDESHMSKSETAAPGRRSWPLDDDCVTGMDVPTNRRSEEDIAFWTGTPSYQPWRDVAAFFRGERNQ